MEFKTLRNIENSFRQIRLYAIVFAVLCISVVGYAVWRSYRFAEEQRQKIYVLDNGKSLMLALSQDASINRPVEAREHVRRFHELFFTLAPDKNAIESNMSRAFNLADKSAFDYYNYRLLKRSLKNIKARSMLAAAKAAPQYLRLLYLLNKSL